jgi:hypothetical protein
MVKGSTTVACTFLPVVAPTTRVGLMNQDENLSFSQVGIPTRKCLGVLGLTSGRPFAEVKLGTVLVFGEGTDILVGQPSLDHELIGVAATHVGNDEQGLV